MSPQINLRGFFFSGQSFGGGDIAKCTRLQTHTVSVSPIYEKAISVSAPLHRR
jgi:hypothetical protein